MEMLIFTSEDTTVFSSDTTALTELYTNAKMELHLLGHAWPPWEDVHKDTPLKCLILTMKTMKFTMIAQSLLDSKLNHSLFLQELKR